jgi:hypothetical protein
MFRSGYRGGFGRYSTGRTFCVQADAQTLLARLPRRRDLFQAKEEEKAILKNAMLDLRDAKAAGLLNGKPSWVGGCELHVDGFVFNLLDDKANPTYEVCYTNS